MSLTTVSQLKLHLGVTGSTQDAFLSQLLSGAEAAFKRLTDRDIEATDYVCYLSGRNTPILLLPEYPVISITGVWLDRDGYYGTPTGAFADATELTSGIDYALVRDGKAGVAETGRLFKIGGVWPGRWERRPGLLSSTVRPGAGNIKASYRAGYEVVPDDVQLCLWQVCAQLRSARALGAPYSSERYEEYAYQIATDAMSLMRVGSAAQTVARFKRIRPRHCVLG